MKKVLILGILASAMILMGTACTKVETEEHPTAARTTTTTATHEVHAAY
jgi:hypothetical protein